MENFDEASNYSTSIDTWHDGPYYSLPTLSEPVVEQFMTAESDVQVIHRNFNNNTDAIGSLQLDPALLDASALDEDSEESDSGLESTDGSDEGATSLAGSKWQPIIFAERGHEMADPDSRISPSIAGMAEQEGAPIVKRRGRPPGSRGRWHKRPDMPMSSNVLGRAKGRRGGRWGRRGPNKIAEPDPEFKRLQGQATTAYLKREYSEALDYAQQAVRSNPEIFAAHSLLSEIYLSMELSTESALALFTGAHTRRDPKIWWQVADRVTQLQEVDREEILQRSLYCYVMILKYDKDDYAAREEKVKVLLEKGAKGKARFDCEVMLKHRPGDMETLRLHTLLSKELKEEQKGIDVFDASIEYIYKMKQRDVSSAILEIVSLYLELFVKTKNYGRGLLQSKRLARSLLGRSSEAYWDEIDDDREWDLWEVPRRVEVLEFRHSRYDISLYGQGLVPELRSRIGIFRLLLGEQHFNEAWRHFEILTSNADQTEIMIRKFPEVFRDAANLLRIRHHHEEALLIYNLLRQSAVAADESFGLAIAACHHGLKNIGETISCLNSIIQKDAGSVEARIQLARVYEENGQTELATMTARDVLNMRKFDQLRLAQRRVELRADVSSVSLGTTRDSRSNTVARHGRNKTPKPSSNVVGRVQAHRAKREKIWRSRDQLNILRANIPTGNEEAALHWMTIARLLMLEFQQNREFFPTRDKHNQYLKAQTQRSRYGRNVAELTELAKMDGVDGDLQSNDHPIDDFYGVHFDEWLDMYCFFAYLAAGRGFRKDCWGALGTASTANVFILHDKRSKLLHACTLACSIILNNEAQTCRTWRWFVKKYSFSSDVFRLYGSLNRYHVGLKSFYNDGPSQKFIMRQIKSMDFALLPADARKTYNFTEQERSALTGGGAHDGNPLGLTDHDPALFAVHAHALASGGAYPAALNYYFRAFSLTPNDPILNLCIGLCYIQHAMKRMSENRQYQIQQGLSFVLRYFTQRTSSISPLHMQEAEFNMGRVWHMLGLLHLALPAYQRCLDLSEQIRESENETVNGTRGRAGIAAEAAFAMQSICTINADFERAGTLTKYYLVIE